MEDEVGSRPSIWINSAVLPGTLYVIVLHYGSVADTLSCLRALNDCDPAGWKRTLVLVDNAMDGIGALLNHGGPEVLIEPSRNLGFAGGCNAGIRLALEHGASHVLLLNNDVVLAPDALIELWRGVERNPDSGVYGGKLLFAERPGHVWYAGGRIRPWSARAEHIGFCGVDRLDAGNDRPVEFVTGAFMLIQRGVFETVGLLNEAFHVYGEDTDLCIRCTSARIHLTYLPRVRGWHRVGNRLAALPPHYLYYATRNRYSSFRHCGGHFYGLYLRVLNLVLHGVIRAAVECLRNPNDRKKVLAAIGHGTLDGLCGRRGAHPRYR